MKLCSQCATGYPESLTTCPTHGGMLHEIRDLKPGMLIRQSYRIIRKLGQGGMGSVYLAQHLLMDEPRALKFLSTELSQDTTFTGRFLREVRTLRQVRSPNVVECGDLERAEDDSLFFSMEFVDGPDLRDFFVNAQRPFNVALALEITCGIATGLGAAHLRGMVHRDIKPENILMARDGERWVPKVADFGIVATKENSSIYTRTRGTLLTMAYAAPEQWRGIPAADLDGRTDFYALGGLLFELLTGQTAFQAESYEGWMYQHLQTQPPTPSNIRPDLARWRGLDALVLGLLSKNRDQRPANVAALLERVHAVRHVSPPAPRAAEANGPDRSGFRSASAAGPLGLFGTAEPEEQNSGHRDRAPLSIISGGYAQSASSSDEPEPRDEDHAPHRHKHSGDPITLFARDEPIAPSVSDSAPLGSEDEDELTNKSPAERILLSIKGSPRTAIFIAATIAVTIVALIVVWIWIATM